MMGKFCTLLILFFCGIKIQAQTCTTNTNSVSWTNSGIWSCGNVPLAANDVVINHTGITFTTANNAIITIKSLTINNNRDLTINGNFRLIITGNLVLDNQASLILSGGATIDILGSFNAANNGNVSVGGSGTGGSFLSRGCYTIGGGTPKPNIFVGSNLKWCIQCVSGNVGGNCNQILPVRLLFFKGAFQNLSTKPSVSLEWSVLANSEFQYFEIERSEDGIKFEKIERINKSALGNPVQNYQFTDESPFPNQTYYRLKEVENGGFFNYSRIIGLSSPIQDWVVWKNINGNWEVNSQKTIEEIRIQNSVGKCLFENTYSNVTKITINSNPFPSGIYIVSVRTISGLFFKKVQF